MAGCVLFFYQDHLFRLSIPYVDHQRPLKVRRQRLGFPAEGYDREDQGFRRLRNSEGRNFLLLQVT